MDGILNVLPNQQLTEDSFLDKKTGLITCKSCGKRREKYIEILGVKKKVPIMCRCQIAAQVSADKIDEQRAFKRRLTGYERLLNVDLSYKQMTLSKDDGTRPQMTDFIKRYTNHFDDLKRDNIGILFYGSVGTGKTFFAHALVNMLQDKGVLASSISLATLVSLFQTFEIDRRAVIDAVKVFEFLVIDDLGSERFTSFGLEVVYAIVDARLKSNRPTLFTTNLDLKTLETVDDIGRRRIYDRVIEMTPVKLKFSGASKRAGISESRKAKARQLMYPTGGDET